MRRRFVIAAEPLTAEQEAKLRDYIGKLGAWWHWIANFWLLTIREDTAAHADASAEKIRDFIYELNPKAKIVVFEFPEDITWAASGTLNSKGKRLSDWLKEPWGSD
ncbi:MAG TPA: hypothetical protein VNR39_12940 [Pseudolabrys sp.]|nr:hypothetical protein [Pseudolabrys sp.]